ncbi:winged helix DNA-binding domain-containing protein [Arthrobacter crusticola]|uniref:Winged helix DNA-binding domain-containing protein n=1 Tax=Arthrobacter crusticola TaxID=2547960 RepID=A0A4R5TR46_9MICC|nr:winged helix DNA-binding domain-containing protein [Arthrobacter crusticola]TDK24149.1 winged helix DNA-binding domain-containing protein [Arthrobacter crusticola]
MAALAVHDLRQLRLRSHRLGESPSRGPAETVRRMLAVQAQNLAGARWSLGLRTPGLTDAALADALRAGTIVQTWTMRGTLHLTAPADAPWLLSLLGPRAWSGRGKLWRDAGLTGAVFEKAADVLGTALEGTALPRNTVLRLLEDAGIPTGGQRGSHILRYLAETQVVIIGPPQGRTQTFASFRDRIPAVEPPGREEALARLAFRYISGHGPATARDLAWWSGLTLADSRLALHLAAPALAVLPADGEPSYADPEVLDARSGGPATAHLLPGFDEYTIGYADRTLVLEERHRSAVGPAVNGLFRPALAVSGRIRGTWEQENRGGSVRLRVATFPGEALPGAHGAAALRAAADRYSRFLELPVVLDGADG